MASSVGTTGLLTLLWFTIILLVQAHQTPLRVPLTKRTLDAEQVKATQEALQAHNVKTLANSLRGEPEEADIPLLDFLDAQCMLPDTYACQRCKSFSTFICLLTNLVHASGNNIFIYHF